MKKIIYMIFLACIFCQMQAQDYADLIRKNPAMAAVNMTNYNIENSRLTPAPKGYKAFYISHYGRHGSRYQSSDRYAAELWPLLRKVDSLGLMSEAGKAFYKDFDAVMQEQCGMYGMLTSLGAQEHRGIAQRMASTFKDVFKGCNGRTEIYCQSSTAPRCLVSMTNFAHSLDRHAEKMNFHFATGKKIYNYLAYQNPSNPSVKIADHKEDSLRRAVMKPLELVDYFFADREKALEIIGDPYQFEKDVYLASCVGHLTDYGVCLLSHFPAEILIRNWEVRNARFYLAFGMAQETGEYQKETALRLISDFISRAEHAVKEDSRVAADFRFGHDVALLPTIGYIGIDGIHNWPTFESVNSIWNSSVSICMASNLQFIFYRNKSGNVLVKVLYNEKETSIPAVPSVYGNYYRWSDLEKYLESLL